jgi:hypothetical protein
VLYTSKALKTDIKHQTEPDFQRSVYQYTALVLDYKGQKKKEKKKRERKKPPELRIINTRPKARE